MNANPDQTEVLPTTEEVTVPDREQQCARPGEAPDGPPDRFLFATSEQLGEAALNLGTREDPSWRRSRRAATVGLARWLEQFPGQSWQERWAASGIEELGLKWWTLTGLGVRRSCRGAVTLMALRAIRPSYGWMVASELKTGTRRFQEVNDVDAFARIHAAADEQGIRPDARSAAVLTLVRIMMGTGKAMAEVDKDDFAVFIAAMQEVHRPASAHVTWQLMRHAGFLSGEAPSLRAAMAVGPTGIAEIVDRHNLDCQPVRDVFVDYLKHRAPALDYVSLRGICHHLVTLFWADLEAHNPGICSLQLSPEASAGWKRRIQARMSPSVYLAHLVTVRAFYLDLAEWALDEPERWGRWAAPSPVRSHELKGHRRVALHVTARMHARTRSLAPLLPVLTRSAQQWMKGTGALLAAAGAAGAGEEFVVNDRRYRRLGTKGQGIRTLATRPRIRVEERFGEGVQIDVSWLEDDCFWSWAVIEVLRLTGLRLEELLELTHLGLRQYIRRGGEVTPLLQVSPSKIDRERVIPMSPELVHALASILRRIRGPNGTVPLVERYDKHERTFSEPLPYLFQRALGSRRIVQGAHTVLRLLRRGAERAAITEVDGQQVVFTAHDFRRIFATEIVNGGLPIHIGAKLLGHLDLKTTQRYLAIYPEEVIRHFETYLARRRAERPGDEYREPTAAEWVEFEEHFALRKVALGDCGRPYGTPCIHEHACVRCPFLRVDPAQLHRLVELEENTAERIREAHDRGWAGEVTGLNESLIHITRKKEQAVHLGANEQLSLA